MYTPKMHLTDEEMAILRGEKGDTLAKVMETVVRFGDIFDAPKLVPVTHHEGHLVTSFGIGLSISQRCLNYINYGTLPA